MNHERDNKMSDKPDVIYGRPDMHSSRILCSDVQVSGDDTPYLHKPEGVELDDAMVVSEAEIARMETTNVMLQATIATLTAERDEQLRINQIGQEREARLMAENKRLIALLGSALAHTTDSYSRPIPTQLKETKYEQASGDLSCPGCGGPAEFDRCVPPNPYYCEDCEMEGSDNI